MKRLFLVISLIMSFGLVSCNMNIEDNAEEIRPKILGFSNFEDYNAGFVAFNGTKYGLLKEIPANTTIRYSGDFLPKTGYRYYIWFRFTKETGERWAEYEITDMLNTNYMYDLLYVQLDKHVCNAIHY